MEKTLPNPRTQYSFTLFRREFPMPEDTEGEVLGVLRIQENDLWLASLLGQGAAKGEMELFTKIKDADKRIRTKLLEIEPKASLHPLIGIALGEACRGNSSATDLPKLRGKASPQTIQKAIDCLQGMLTHGQKYGITTQQLKFITLCLQGLNKAEAERNLGESLPTNWKAPYNSLLHRAGLNTLNPALSLQLGSALGFLPTYTARLESVARPEGIPVPKIKPPVAPIITQRREEGYIAIGRGGGSFGSPWGPGPAGF
jgi:hypothetical protein